MGVDEGERKDSGKGMEGNEQEVVEVTEGKVRAVEETFVQVKRLAGSLPDYLPDFVPKGLREQVGEEQEEKYQYS